MGWIYQKQPVALNNILRIFFNRDYDYHIEKLLNNFNVLSIKKLYYMSFTTFIAKYNHINKITHNHNTRYNQNNKLITKMWKTATQSYFVSVGSSILNKLPIEVQNLDSKHF